MEALFFEWVRSYGYIILFMWCVLEGETALLTAGIFAHTGDMNLTLAIIIGALGGMSGDHLYFHIGRTNKSYIYKKLHKQRRKFAIAHMLLMKRGRFIVFLQRFLYGLRVVLPLSVGLTGFSRVEYILINGASSFLWATIFCTIGWWFGEEALIFVAFIKAHWYIAIPILGLFLGSAFLFFQNIEKHILLSRSKK